MSSSTSTSTLSSTDDSLFGPHTWRRLLAPYRKRSWWAATWQVVNTLVPLFALFALMVWSLGVGYWLTLLLAIPTAGFLARLFVVQHDCGHDCLFPSRRVNNIVGACLGVINLTPYAYWRRVHAAHHATSGNLDRRGLGDVDTLTVSEYRALGWRQRAWYRIYRNPLMLLGFGALYQFGFKHRVPYDVPLSWRREWRSVILTNLSLAAVVAALIATIGWKALLLVYAPVFLLAYTAAVWMFYLQHQFEETYWDAQQDWDFYEAAMEGSTYYRLPRVLQFFTANIGLHHVHHLCSRIPNYRLQEVLDDLPELRDQVTTITLGGGLRYLWLSLWDEQERRLISFRELRSQSAS